MKWHHYSSATMTGNYRHDSFQCSKTMNNTKLENLPGTKIFKSHSTNKQNNCQRRSGQLHKYFESGSKPNSYRWIHLWTLIAKMGSKCPSKAEFHFKKTQSRSTIILLKRLCAKNQHIIFPSKTCNQFKGCENVHLEVRKMSAYHLVFFPFIFWDSISMGWAATVLFITCVPANFNLSALDASFAFVPKLYYPFFRFGNSFFLFLDKIFIIRICVSVSKFSILFLNLSNFFPSILPYVEGSAISQSARYYCKMREKRRSDPIP